MAFNSYKAFEFIVVDHASEDNTLVLLNHWQKSLPIKIIACDTNHSFSYSNNMAAKTANGEILLFLNNDIVFNQDIVGSMVNILEDSAVGLVGAKLLNVTFHNDRPTYPNVQHLGIQFCIDRHANKITPHDLHLMQESTGTLSRAVYMPAVTGAVMMARKKEFLEVEGFHEEYFYGF